MEQRHQCYLPRRDPGGMAEVEQMKPRGELGKIPGRQHHPAHHAQEMRQEVDLSAQPDERHEGHDELGINPEKYPDEQRRGSRVEIG